jgi:hypothetical protein
MMLMVLSRRGGCCRANLRSSAPVGWSEPARLVAAEQRLIVPIEGNQSCGGTISQPAIQACSNVVTHERLPHTALALLEQYPYRSRPTLPTHTASIRQMRKYLIYECSHLWWRVVAGLITYQLLCAGLNAYSSPTGAMRMQYRPALRHLRSRIGSPTSDGERQSTLLQFVRTDSDWRRGPQPRVGHSPNDFMFRVCC